MVTYSGNKKYIRMMLLKTSGSQLDTSGKRKNQLRNYIIRLACGPIYGAFSWLLMDVGGPTPSQAGMGKKDGWAGRPWQQGTEQHPSVVSISIPHPGSCLKLLYWCPLMIDSDFKRKETFSSPSCFWSAFYHINRKQTRTLYKRSNTAAQIPVKGMASHCPHAECDGAQSHGIRSPQCLPHLPGMVNPASCDRAGWSETMLEAILSPEPPLTLG